LKNKTLKHWFDYYQCDKSSSHSYHVVYEPYLDKFTTPFNLLEIGIFRGASSRAFINCYDNVHYYGVDIFDRESVDIVSDLEDNPRFEFLKTDSTSDTSTKLIKDGWGDVLFDIIIDDGSHLHDDITTTFANFYPMLKVGGTYFIEDVFPNTFEGLVFTDNKLTGQRNYFLDNNNKFNDKTFSNLLDTIEGVTPSTFEHIDLRVQDNRTDSYILKITK